MWSGCEGCGAARVAEAVVGGSLSAQSLAKRAAMAVELAAPRKRGGSRRSHTRPQASSPPPNSTSPSSSSSTGKLDFVEKIELLKAAGEADLELGLTGGSHGREG
ncbi:hypothetical protein OsI_25809 [Oryza sativa Indica Group]|uniref:Uncharacterized protein n=1 Tax=Oryza sativa subsp. indica TaxID=39946 RepID=A2YKR1_ORYSI|nr:hypothetical protein OsI_25809 [Oryza sativa Indica Group]